VLLEQYLPFRRRYTNFTLVVQLDEVGECSYVLLQDGAPPPSVAQVQSGTTSTGAAALASGVVAVPAAFADSTAALTGLQDETPYDVYLVCRDDAEPVPNVMPSATLLPVTTAGMCDFVRCRHMLANCLDSFYLFTIG
jgi:hypothetical protein